MAPQVFESIVQVAQDMTRQHIAKVANDDVPDLSKTFLRYEFC